MADLRQALGEFGDVRTYLQSGNVVLASDRSPKETQGELERLIEIRFGLPVQVIMRTGDELADVVRRNPLADVAANPKRYQVTFLEAELPTGRAEELQALCRGDERLVIDRREVYAWHPDGVARSKLWAKLASTGLGVAGTSRNWTTVCALVEMAAAQ
jgi:uncharacterized protein (DUF1697 family)